MNVDARARASAQAIRRSRTRLDPVAGLEDLLRRRRRRLVGRAVIAVATATMVAVVALVGIRELQPPTTVTQPPGLLGRVTATIPVGGDPSDVLVSEGAVWVAAGQSVSRIDPATGTKTSTVGAGPRPRLAAGFGSIWAANNDPSGVSVTRIDARTGQVMATIPITVTAPAVKPTQLAVGAGAVWVIASNTTANQLLRIDPTTNQAIPISTVGEFMGSGIAVTDRRVSLSGRDDQLVPQLVRVNTTTNRITDPLPTDGDGALTTGGGSLWQAGVATQTIYRLDLKSGRKLAEIPIGVAPQQLTAGDGSLLVGSPSGRVTRIDLATNTVTGTFQVNGPAPAAASGLGAVWITDTTKAALLRVQPG